MKVKVYAYILHNGKLLVFRHTQYPEAGIQVPGGSLEAVETPEAGVLREAREETGLDKLRVVKYIGRDQICVLGEPVERYFFRLEVSGDLPETWLGYEWQPSDGSPAPIEFEFFWVAPGEAELSGGQGWGLDL